MSPFDFLGVSPDADERTIKRAYAKQLRSTRPEDDPVGFQQLHTAYQAALEHCRAASPKAAATSMGAITQAAVRLSERPVVEALVETQSSVLPVAPAFDVDAFCTAAFKRAEVGAPLALLAWLNHQQDLWSLQLKARTGHYLMQQMYQQTPPMPASCMETLLRFFDLGHVLAGHDPLDLLQLARRTRLAWQLQPTDQAGLQGRINLRTPSSNWRMYWIVVLLKRPFSWPRALWIGLYPTNPSLIVDFVEELSDKHPEDLPASIDRTQLQFWLDAGDRTHVTRKRLALGAARSVVMLLGSVGLAPLFSLLYTYRVALKPMLITIGIVMVPSALWIVWAAWASLAAWYVRSEPSLRQWSWSRQSLAPILCAAGLIISMNDGTTTGLVLVLAALWLCLRRLEAFHTGRNGLLISMCLRFISIPIAFNLAAQSKEDTLSFNLIIATVAMLAWAFDLWRRRPLQTRRS